MLNRRRLRASFFLFICSAFGEIETNRKHKYNYKNKIIVFFSEICYTVERNIIDKFEIIGNRSARLLQ